MRSPILTLLLLASSAIHAQGPVASYYPYTREKVPNFYTNTEPYDAVATSKYVVSIDHIRTKPEYYQAYVFDRASKAEVFRGKVGLPENVRRVSELIISKDELYLIWEAWGEDKYADIEVYSQKVSLPTMVTTGEAKLLFTLKMGDSDLIEQASWPDGMRYTVRTSPDRSKWLLYMDRCYVSSEIKRMVCVVMDTGMTPLWTFDAQMHLMKVNNREEVCVSNGGIVYAVYREAAGRAFWDSKEAPILVRVQAGGIKTRTITAPPGTEIHGTGITTEGERVVLLGFTASSSYADGYFRLDMNAELDDDKLVTGMFDNPEKFGVMRCELVSDSPEVMYFLGSHIEGDLIVLALDHKGQKLWSSSTPMADPYRTISPRQEGPNLVIAYYDSRGNIEKMNNGGGLKRLNYLKEPAMCIFDAQGKMRVVPMITEWDDECDVLKNGVFHHHRLETDRGGTCTKYQAGSGNGPLWRTDGVFVEYTLTKDHSGLTLVEWK